VDFPGNIGGSPYNGRISTKFQSPIAGRQAWTGNSGGYVRGGFTLWTQKAERLVFRFRLATDCSGRGRGWRIDSIAGVALPGICPTATPIATATATATASPTSTLTP